MRLGQHFLDSMHISAYNNKTYEGVVGAESAAGQHTDGFFVWSAFINETHVRKACRTCVFFYAQVWKNT